MGQLVTGSCVNTVLAIAALAGGLSCGLVVALCSPVLAFLLGIAPQILTVPAIMVGNTVFVVLLALLADKTGKNLLKQMITWIAAAAAKFAALYAIVVWLICGLLSEQLIAEGIMKAPMLKVLPATFSWPQLFTALIGGAVALLITPVLRKALHK
jgi:Trk-type K+ transport system membrane component